MEDADFLHDEFHNTSYFIVPKNFLQKILDNQLKILSLLESNKRNLTPVVGDYFSEDEAKKMLGFKTTWFWQMRTSGQLQFTKLGKKVFYHKDSILSLLKNKPQK